VFGDFWEIFMGLERNVFKIIKSSHKSFLEIELTQAAVENYLNSLKPFSRIFRRFSL
jgi:hypothetical protein